MNPSEVSTSLVRAVKHKRPAIIVGGPGIGKTSVVKKVTKALDHDLVITTPAVSDPTDGKGLGFPSEDGTHAKFLPLGQMHQLITATRPTIWFIDDLGQGSPAVQASLMPWLLERQCAGNRLPDCVTTVAATNGREHKANVSGLLEPVKSRFHKILHMEPCYQQWRKEFAVPYGIPLDILAYLDWQGAIQNAKFNKFEPSNDMKNSPIPRTWTNAGDLINDYLLDSDGDESELDDMTSVLFHDVVGAIGLAEAGEVWKFREMRSELKSSIDEIIADPNRAFIPKNIDAQFAVINAVAHRADAENLDRILCYANRLHDAIPKEMPVTMLNDIFLRKPELKETPAFVKVITSPKFATAFTGNLAAATA